MIPSPPTNWIPVRVESMSEADLEPVLDIEYLSFTSPWPRDIFLGELRGSDIARYLWPGSWRAISRDA